MTPFLQQVARHYHASGDMSRMCFVFPNKRSAAFFRKYLGAECAAAGRAMIAPACLTMNDFFRILSGCTVADRVSLTLALYECYRRLNPSAEALDEFVFWGGVLLSDFGEVDKYMVNAAHIFRNVSEYRQMQDSLDYLEPGQKEALEQFLWQFRDQGEYKERFRRIWDLLLPLYRDFNASLDAKGLAYEGATYRKLAERLDGEAVTDILMERFASADKFVFVGLNALNECEKKLLRKMRDAGAADFCWDYSGDEIRDPDNRSSFFLARNVKDFPQAFEPDTEGLVRPVVHAVSVPSAVGQTKVVAEILSAMASADGGSSQVGIETAVVLPDEGLLLPMLNSLPENIADVNVTMGYPMRGGEFHALMSDIAALQLNARVTESGVRFYHRQVWGLFSNGILARLMDDSDRETVAAIRNRAMYYVPAEDFAGSPLLSCIFRHAEDIPSYELDILTRLAPMMREKGGMDMELDFAMAWYKAVSRLKELSPDVQPRTWFRLMDQLVVGSAVPLNGEPLKGLQIMGPLETRALDFERLIILSCNEGIFPRRSVSASFIPPELRRGFGLPTYEYQDSVWAYYFYRSIQRAKEVWLLSDSRTEGLRQGEESRYIRQLEMVYGFDVQRSVAKAPLGNTAVALPEIEKTAEHVAAMHEPGFLLSASRLQDYLVCPARFYYAKVRGLRPADEVSESLDAGMMGTVLHRTMQLLYDGRPQISLDYLEGLVRDPEPIRNLVRDGIREQLRSEEIGGRNLIFEELIFRYALQIVRIDIKLLKDKGLKSFRIFGLELGRKKTIGGFRFTGSLDRVDSFEEGTVRIVDYKTGKVTDMDSSITDDNAEKAVEALFGTDNGKRPKIALQLYIYDLLLEGHESAAGRRVFNCIYQTSDIFVKEPAAVPRSERFCSLMKERLEGLLQELDDTSVPWKRTEDADACKYCDFKDLCGR